MQELATIPASLREIPEPPKKLWLEGPLPDPDEKIYLAFVGSRKFSSYGRDACREIIAGLAGYPFVIVSGLAIGIDTIAHRAAIEAKLPTVAVPGSGLDRKVLYPSQNRTLAQEILDAGGALLSEYEPTYRATIYSFPKRNRIMAGLCRGTVIVEATEKSGTLITARLALDYNRDVFAIPGSIFSEGSIGTNRLISQGATPVTSAADILAAYNLEPGTQKDLPLQDLLPMELTIFELLAEPLPRDTLIATLGISTPEANSIITMMEIKGIIKESVGELRRAH
jgi:DNA processing protein